MTTYPNPFRINLDTIQKAIDHDMRTGRLALLIASMWDLFHDADDTSVDLVGDNASISWDVAGAYTDLDMDTALEVMYLYGEGIRETINVFERLAPQFDALSDDDERGIDLREIDTNTTVLPLHR